MYWDNTWINTFNYKNFFNKTLFLGSILHIIFSEKIFNFFFLNKTKKNLKQFTFFQKSLLKNKKKITNVRKKKHKKPKKYNFTRI